MSARLATIVLTAALAGCGAGSGAESRATQTVRDWTSAIARHDGPAACRLLSVRLQHSINRHLLGEGVRGSCRTWAARWVSPRHAASQEDVRVTAVRIRGSRATVTLAAPGVSDARAKLVMERGHWRIDDY